MAPIVGRGVAAPHQRCGWALVVLVSVASAYDNDGADGGPHRALNRLALDAFVAAHAADPVFGNYDLAPSGVSYRLAPTSGDHPFVAAGDWVVAKGDWPAGEQGVGTALLGLVPNTYAPSYVREEQQQRPFQTWVVEGGFSADEPEVYMALRHFYDPGANGLDMRAKPPRRVSYLTDQLNLLAVRLAGLHNPEIDAKQWALTESAYSLRAGRAALETALTSPSEDRRSQRLAFNWRALGETMHLLADMTVPAHVRNDGHPGLSGWLGTAFNLQSDPFEAYCTAPRIKQHAASGQADPAVLALLAKCRTPDELFDAVARYTNRGFFSRDTIAGRDALTGKPVANTNGQPVYASPRLEQFKWRPTGKRTGYYEAADGEPVAWAYDGRHDLTEGCAAAQAARLVPLAVAANVRLLELALPRFRLAVASLDRPSGRLRCRLAELQPTPAGEWVELDAPRFPGTKPRALLLVTRGTDVRSVWVPVDDPRLGEFTLALPVDVAKSLDQPETALTVGIDLGGILIKSAPWQRPALAIVPAKIEARVGETQALLAAPQGLPAGVRFVWNCGDGSPTVTVDGPTVRHNWRAAGTYTVRLGVLDAAGRELPLTATAQATVRPPYTPTPVPSGRWAAELDLVPRDVVEGLLPPEAAALGWFEDADGKVPADVARTVYHGFRWAPHAGGGGYRRREGTIVHTRPVKVDTNKDDKLDAKDPIVQERSVSWYRLEVRAALGQVGDWRDRPAETGSPLSPGVSVVAVGDRATLSRANFMARSCNTARGPLTLAVSVQGTLQTDDDSQRMWREFEKAGVRRVEYLDPAEYQRAVARVGDGAGDLAVQVARELVAEWDRYYLSRPLPGNGFKGLVIDLEPYCLTSADVPFLQLKRDIRAYGGEIQLQRLDPGQPLRVLERYSVSYARQEYWSHIPLSRALEESRKLCAGRIQAFKHPVPAVLPGADLAGAQRWRDRGNFEAVEFCKDNVFVQVTGFAASRSSLSPLPYTLHLARLALAKLGGPPASELAPDVADPLTELARYRLVRILPCAVMGTKTLSPAGEAWLKTHTPQELQQLKARGEIPEGLHRLHTRITGEVYPGEGKVVLPLRYVEQLKWDGGTFAMSYRWKGRESELLGSATGTVDPAQRVLTQLNIRETWHLRHMRDDVLYWDKDEYRVEVRNARTPLLGLGAETMDSWAEQVAYAHSHSDNYSTKDRQMALIYREQADWQVPLDSGSGLITFFR